MVLNELLPKFVHWLVSVHGVSYFKLYFVFWMMYLHDITFVGTDRHVATEELFNGGFNVCGSCAKSGDTLVVIEGRLIASDLTRQN